ncbi:MAG: HD domain-containing protein [Xanthobacteraceae bacterium]
MPLVRLKSVAGVTIPDTALCNAAVDLLESSSPEFLCTHCLRTYIFGSLAVRDLGRSVVDEEAAFCGSVLHDLGLVPPYRRENRFEVDGADAARQFCSKHQVPPERADLVWRAIALHTSPGIATRLADEIALVYLGAGLDFLGHGLDQVPPQVLEEILEKYPRMKFKSEFRNLLVEHCRNNPAAQVLTWTDDVARTAGCALQGQPIPTASQLMWAAPYDE